MRLALLLTLLAAGCARAEPVRFATFNAALSRESPGELLAAMRTRDDEQAKAVAAVIQAARPDVLVLQEFDHGPGYDPDGEALRLFQANYLAVPQQDDLEPISYEHVYLAPSNTGKPTGVDLNSDGRVAPCPGAEVGTDAYAADCHGWGKYPGHYAFVILSKHPIDREGIRTFGELLWKDLPNNHLPDDYYNGAAKAVLRLSSKNHVVVPIEIGGETIDVLAAHPTPPVFDGEENRNGRRNFDEIGLWSLWLFHWNGQLYLLRDDDGQRPDVATGSRVTGRTSMGGRASSRGAGRFVILGDFNADPHDGESMTVATDVELIPANLWFWSPHGDRRAADVISDHHATASHLYTDLLPPTSPGGVAAAERDGGVNAEHAGDPAADTADWDDERGPGNLRVDYVLPSADLDVTGGGVLWPTADEPMMGVDLATVERASDHRLVWVDVDVR